MSEDFDKEAEREKLRQQLEQEEAAREATQHMSELLLKGATMTNKHCGECGDPIFRHQGREFCPTCERPTGTEQPTAEGTDPGTEHGAPPGDAASTDAAAEPVEEGPDRGVEVSDTDDGRTGAGSERSPPADREPRRPPSPRLPVDGDLGEARASLVRTVTALAREAESADDVRRTRDLLAAAREGAEAIAAIDGSNR